MTLCEKLEKLGYIQDDNFYEKNYNDEIHQVIRLTNGKRKIAEYYIYYDFGWFEKQEQIDDIQIAFNRLNKDIKEIKNGRNK